MTRWTSSWTFLGHPDRMIEARMPPKFRVWTSESESHYVQISSTTFRPTFPQKLMRLAATHRFLLVMRPSGPSYQRHHHSSPIWWESHHAIGHRGDNECQRVFIDWWALLTEIVHVYYRNRLRPSTNKTGQWSRLNATHSGCTIFGCHLGGHLVGAIYWK